MQRGQAAPELLLARVVEPAALDPPQREPVLADRERLGDAQRARGGQPAQSLRLAANSPGAAPARVFTNTSEPSASRAA